jgi:hypothetical protein
MIKTFDHIWAKQMSFSKWNKRMVPESITIYFVSLVFYPFKFTLLRGVQCKSFPLIQWENQSFFSNLTGLEHKDLLPLTDFFYYQCVAH